MKMYLFAGLTAFAFSFVFCRLLIPLLRRLGAGQNVLSYVKEHEKKNGTPTMGGLAFVLAAVAASAFYIRGNDRIAIVCIVMGVAYMLVGLLDDFLKKKHKENLGLRAWQKFAFQACVAVFAGIFSLRAGLTALRLPFTDKTVDAGGWIVPIVAFVFLATVNAVNLTDGLDGLAAGSCVPFFACMGVLVIIESGNASLATLCFALTGALLAYLLFNISPASVFMGDTGSLALGGFAAAIGAFSGNILYIAVMGVTFVFSVISVILQVIYYKATGGKRIFLMSPAHHHFQKKGYSESKISYAYSVITLLAGALCVCAAL